MAERKEIDLQRDLKATTLELASLNRELAGQMIILASQTGDTAPLIQAVEALRSAQGYYSAESTPRENAEVQQALGDTLLTLGRANDDVEALENAIKAYRGAITLASLMGDDILRRNIKRNYGIARNLLGNRSTLSKAG